MVLLLAIINISLIFHLIRLRRKVNYYKRRAESMHQRAIRDEMTGLYNYGYLTSCIKRKCTPYSLLMLDIDNFKEINDQYGHQIGDRVLNYVTQKLRLSVRKSDLIGRYGGDEFVIILFDCTTDRSKKIAEEIRSNVSEGCRLDSGELIDVTVSIGVYTSNICDDLDEVLGKADRALYQAKNQGRNRIVNYGS